MRKKNPMCNMCGLVKHPLLTRYCRECKKLYMRRYRAIKKDLALNTKILSTPIASQSGQ